MCLWSLRFITMIPPFYPSSLISSLSPSLTHIEMLICGANSYRTFTQATLGSVQREQDIVITTLKKLLPCKNHCRPRGRCRKLQESLTESKVIFFPPAIQFCTAVRVYTYVCGWWVLPPQLPLPSLFLFNVTGLAHMTLSSSTGTARVSYLACMHSWTGSARQRNKKKSSWCGPIDISAATHLPLHSHFYSIFATSYLFPWWEEFH